MKKLRLLNTIVVVMAGLIAAPIICSAGGSPLVNYARLESFVVNHLHGALKNSKGIARILVSSHCEC